MYRKVTVAVIFGLLIVLFGIYVVSRSNDVAGEIIITLSATPLPERLLGDVAITLTGVEAWNPEQGWVMLSDTERILSLDRLATEGTLRIAQTEPEIQTFDRLRLHIQEVLLLPENDEQKEEPSIATLSDFITLDAPIPIATETTTGIHIQLHTTDSLYSTISSSWVFIPQVSISAFSQVSVIEEKEPPFFEGGTNILEAKYGMDETGNMRQGYTLPASLQFQVRGGSILITSPNLISPITSEARGTTTSTGTTPVLE